MGSRSKYRGQTRAEYWKGLFNRGDALSPEFAAQCARNMKEKARLLEAFHAPLIQEYHAPASKRPGIFQRIKSYLKGKNEKSIFSAIRHGFNASAKRGSAPLGNPRGL